MAEPSDGAPNDPEAQPAEADDGFVYRDPDMAPAALVQLAKQGGERWVFEVDPTNVLRDRPIAMRSVVGMWEVDEEGELTGWFAENDSYESTEVGGYHYTLQLFPHDVFPEASTPLSEPAVASSTTLSYKSPDDGTDSAPTPWWLSWIHRPDSPKIVVLFMVGVLLLYAMIAAVVWVCIRIASR